MTSLEPYTMNACKSEKDFEEFYAHEQIKRQLFKMFPELGIAAREMYYLDYKYFIYDERVIGTLQFHVIPELTVCVYFLLYSAYFNLDVIKDALKAFSLPVVIFCYDKRQFNILLRDFGDDFRIELYKGV